jgi:hypothetical protein
VTASSALDGPSDMVFGPDGNLYVVGRFNNRVVRYNGTNGAFMDIFATNNLSQPFGLRFGWDGKLYVVSGNNNSVQRFNGTTGAFLDTVVTNGGGSLSFPIGIEFKYGRDCYVASFGNNKIARFSPTIGVYRGDFISTNSGGLNGPNFLLFRPPRITIAPPSLRIFLETTTVAVAWATTEPGFGLQETTSISSNAAWVSVTDSVVFTNSSNTVTLPLNSGNRFFRLMMP